jgi:hypothetical protein
LEAPLSWLLQDSDVVMSWYKFALDTGFFTIREEL